MSVIHVSDKPAIEVMAFHESMFAIADKGEKAQQNMLKQAQALFQSRYADVFPTYAQWENDIAALKAVADQKGRAPEWVLKVYRATCEAIFGALPVSVDADAKRVRESRMTVQQIDAHDKARTAALAEGKSESHAAALAVRAAKKAKTQKVQEQPGAPAGVPKDQTPSPAESCEQYIARIGVFKALDAVVSILAADKSTAAKAKSLASIRAQLARELKPSEQKSA